MSLFWLPENGSDEPDPRRLTERRLKNPAVTVRIAGHTFAAIARIVEEEAEQMAARKMLADKYHEREPDGSLSEWAQTALVVGFDV